MSPAITRRRQIPLDALRLDRALSLVEGTTSAIRFDLDVFGLSIIEHKAGVIATAYGLLADFIRAATAAP